MRLSYMSRMIGSFEQSVQEVENIAVASSAANEKAAITGNLCYDASLQQVWQVLEGEYSAVEPLWERIRCDARHSICMESVEMVWAEARLFPGGWGMKLRGYCAGDMM